MGRMVFERTKIYINLYYFCINNNLLCVFYIYKFIIFTIFYIYLILYIYIFLAIIFNS
ncbi:hypothetical protein H8356DRAFT_1641589 [Neocallimastix lanati (nom. inval.)]|nr:hypothetical protein H8356DRAFT_1641589 [Neocallimastix sp. JGI-2020a]